MREKRIAGSPLHTKRQTATQKHGRSAFNDNSDLCVVKQPWPATLKRKLFQLAKNSFQYRENKFSLGEQSCMMTTAQNWISVISGFRQIADNSALLGYYQCSLHNPEGCSSQN
jgi:hypothetical protein